MLGIAVFRRPVAAWWAIAVAVLLLAVTACGTPPAPPARPVVADGNGGLTNVVANGYRIEAAPGTFPAGNEITIEAADAPTDVGNARVIGNPVQLSSSAQPAKPVIVDTAEPQDVDPALAIAVLRPPAGTGFEVLPVVRLDNGALRARVPHFSVLQFVVFPTVLDRGNQSGVAIRSIAFSQVNASADGLAIPVVSRSPQVSGTPDWLRTAIASSTAHYRSWCWNIWPTSSMLRMIVRRPSSSPISSS